MTHDPLAQVRPADYDFFLPLELIAQVPLPERGASRLLRVPGAGREYRELRFDRVGELLVLNDTRVIPARLFGHKASGGKVEMLLERIVEPDLALVQLRSSRSPREGSALTFDGDATATVVGRRDNFFLLRFDRDVEALLEGHGHMPLPPYIERADAAHDRERYQTVYAAKSGAVAAPTAGLHFDARLLAELAAQGIAQTRITLHVGAGTFLPLRAEQMQRGRLHAERIEVSSETCAAIAAARERGGRVIAVGTTVVRALEAAAAGGSLKPCSGETDIFIWPGYAFRVVDAEF